MHLVLQRMANADYGLVQSIEQAHRSLAEEWRYKKTYIARAIEPITTSVSSAWDTAMQKTQSMRNALHRMIRNNDFYMGDMVEIMETTATHAK